MWVVGGMDIFRAGTPPGTKGWDLQRRQGDPWASSIPELRFSRPLDNQLIDGTSVFIQEQTPGALFLGDQYRCKYSVSWPGSPRERHMLPKDRKLSFITLYLWCRPQLHKARFYGVKHGCLQGAWYKCKFLGPSWTQWRRICILITSPRWFTGMWKSEKASAAGREQPLARHMWMLLPTLPTLRFQHATHNHSICPFPLL